MRLLSRVVTAGRCWSCLGVSKVGGVGRGEAMSLRSMRKAARLAASDTYPSRTQRSRLGIESGFRSRSKIIMWSRIQDHHGVGVRREAIGRSHVSTDPSGDCETPFFPDDSDARATGSRAISLFRELSEVDQPRSRS
jgi:hypothetical protein